MKRRLMIGVAMAAALTLSACGSDDAGTATPPAGMTTSASPVPASADATAATSAVETSASAPTLEGDDDVTSSEVIEPPTSEGSTTSMAETTMMSGPTSSDDSDDDDSDDDDTSGSVVPAALDDQTVAWMSAFCAGYGTLISSGAELEAAEDDEKPETAIPAYISAYDGLGSGLTQLSSTLGDLDAPTFTDGQKVADTFVSAFGEFGPKLTAKAEELAQVDLSDAAAAKAALENASDANDEFNDGMNGQLDALTDLTDAEQEAIQAIPACASMGG